MSFGVIKLRKSYSSQIGLVTCLKTMTALFVTESPEFQTFVDRCYCVFCGAKNQALLDRYTYRYGNVHGNNIKGLDWNNFNKMEGSGLTTKCSCNDIIYRVRILEEISPTIKSAKLQKKPLMDIGYYARMREAQEVVLFGAENKVKVGSGPKPVPKSEIPITNYFTGSLRSITYRPPPQPTVRTYCPVCSATARMQPSQIFRSKPILQTLPIAI